MRCAVPGLVICGLLTACDHIRLAEPQAQGMGQAIVDTMYQQQSQQQCAMGSDAYTRLQCQRQSQQQMQQYRNEQPKKE